MKDNKNNILIIDDDTSILMELTHLLKTEYKIHALRDGITALEKAGDYMPDLILLDIFMPDMNGFEVLAKLKQIDKIKAIPVIFISGATGNDDEAKGLAAGAVGYIRKPFNSNEVITKVRHQIQLQYSKR